jgi:toxin ParE1/3/4
VKQVRFTSAVIQDLKDIYDYIADDSLDAAARFLKRLQNRWLSLAIHPGIGRKRDDLQRHLRSATEGDYVIFYRRKGEGIELVRILHARRNIEQIFKDSL